MEFRIFELQFIMFFIVVPILILGIIVVSGLILYRLKSINKLLELIKLKNRLGKKIIRVIAYMLSPITLLIWVGLMIYIYFWMAHITHKGAQ